MQMAAMNAPSPYPAAIIAAAAILLFPVLVAAAAPEIPTAFLASITRGEWALLQPSIGISAMHMQLLHDNTLVTFDRTDFGKSNLSLPPGQCRHDPNDLALQIDCTAHSVLYDVASNTFRPLFLQTDTWCSSASLLPNGSFLQTGGFNDGDRAIRSFSPCSAGAAFPIPTCDWLQLPDQLAARRWYASNQLLPDGRIIVVGGRNAFSYEFLPKSSASETTFYLSFLKETRDFLEENNLYPFLHLLPDGTLFIFANTRSIAFDYSRGVTVREFPRMPGSDKRNYPSTGSSVLLPLRLRNTDADDGPARLPDSEIMICGGAPNGSFLQATRGVFLQASQTCGRIKVSDPDPTWVMETMPMPRVISDMLLLPTGDVIIINGAQNGTGGWEDADNPAQNPILYVVEEPNPDRRFVVLNPSPIPRMYHSTAALLADGRILVGGSNPHKVYNFTTTSYPTELSLEAFSPYYLAPQYGRLRPSILSVEASGNDAVSYGEVFAVTFSLLMYEAERGVYVTMVAPSFTTHSFAMNQRALVVEVVSVEQLSLLGHRIRVRAPPAPEIAPPGYYMVFVVHAGIPSSGVWVRVLR